MGLGNQLLFIRGPFSDWRSRGGPWCNQVCFFLRLLFWDGSLETPSRRSRRPLHMDLIEHKKVTHDLEGAGVLLLIGDVPSSRVTRGGLEWGPTGKRCVDESPYFETDRDRPMKPQIVHSCNTLANGSWTYATETGCANLPLCTKLLGPCD